MNEHRRQKKNRIKIELDFEKLWKKAVVQLILLNMQEKLFKCDQNHCIRLCWTEKKLIEMHQHMVKNGEATQ